MAKPPKTPKKAPLLEYLSKQRERQRTEEQTREQRARGEETKRLAEIELNRQKAIEEKVLKEVAELSKKAEEDLPSLIKELIELTYDLRSVEQTKDRRFPNDYEEANEEAAVKRRKINLIYSVMPERQKTRIESLLALLSLPEIRLGIMESIKNNSSNNILTHIMHGLKRYFEKMPIKNLELSAPEDYLKAVGLYNWFIEEVYNKTEAKQAGKTSRHFFSEIGETRIIVKDTSKLSKAELRNEIIADLVSLRKLELGNSSKLGENRVNFKHKYRQLSESEMDKVRDLKKLLLDDPWLYRKIHSLIIDTPNAEYREICNLAIEHELNSIGQLIQSNRYPRKLIFKVHELQQMKGWLNIQ